MSSLSRIASLVGSVAVTAALCSAQSITSAHSGTVHYFEGDVTVDGAQVQAKTVGRFTEMKEQGVLRTGLGRAEVLLTPGVFLRVGENSAIRLVDNRLVSTRVELMSGNIAIESDDPQMSIKDSPVTLTYKDYEIRMVKFGLLEAGTDPAIMKVYKGEALVTTSNARATVKEGHELPFSAALLTEKFNDKVGDDLYLWSRDRSQSLSAASMASARSVNANMGGAGYGYLTNGGLGAGAWNGGWYFNPYLNMYTFLSGGDMFMNAFGYGFFSPYTIYSYYTPTTYWYGGGGARGSSTIGRTISGTANPRTGSLPISTLRGGASGNTGGLPALGSPTRGGGVVTASSSGFAGRSAFNGVANADTGIAAGPANIGAGPAGASSAVSAPRGGGFGGGGGGAISAGGGTRGGGGGAPAGGARGR